MDDAADDVASAKLRELYPTTPNRELAGMFGMSTAALKSYAARRGYRKSPEHWRNMQSARMRSRKRSAETRAKLSERARHRAPISEETRNKLKARPVARGAAHYKWKGGRPWARFKDERYIAWRTSVLERDSYTCQGCGRVCSKEEKGLAAHHVKPYAQFPELRYDVANGKTLCRSCHMALHRRPITVNMIPCACGCGTMIRDKDVYGRPHRFVNHHGRRASEPTEAG